MYAIPRLWRQLARVKASRWLVALLAVHAGLLGCGAACHRPTIDEVGHLAAGIGIWHGGRFDLYCVNPPLVRMVAALPVLPAFPKVDWGAPQNNPARRQEFDLGRQLIE